MYHHNSSKDILIGKLVSLNKQININFYYTPDSLTENTLIFDKEQMTQWWKDGYEFAKSKNPVNYCIVPNLLTNSKTLK